MDIATFIGITFGITMVFLAILMGGNMALYIDLPSFILVAGGTIAATLISFPLVKVRGVFGVVKNAFSWKSASPLETIQTLVEFSERARREGILALENSLEEIDDKFLRSGIRLAVDGVEPDLIKDILDTELAFIEDRHKEGQQILLTMGNYAPAFGMIGTLIGLVGMLANLNDVKSIGPQMALAILTTLYGALAANLIFNPLADKLKNRTAEEVLVKEVTIDGIMSIQSGDNPRIAEHRLMAFLAPRDRPKSEA
ncbi:MotA/TolQ/ExbB proton channel family protein [bacterium]|nr:MotA/TolQ/ExbB proton channel family protein [bacterium]